MTERPVHYSAEPLGPIVSVVQPAHHFFKPSGLWVSVEGNGDGWRDWCKDEGWGLERLAHQTAIALKPDAKVLRLSGSAAIDDFTDRYGVDDGFPLSVGRMCVDWPAVAESYQAIIIAPYIWERRLTEHARWYYAWDCASGCIWDAGAIAEARAPRHHRKRGLRPCP